MVKTQIQMPKKSTLKTIPFFNRSFDKKRLKLLFSWYYANKGEIAAFSLVENLQKLGFTYAMKAGISLGVDDLTVPPNKNESLREAIDSLNTTKAEVQSGNVTALEEFQQFVDTWHRTSENLKNSVVINFTKNFKSIKLQSFSNANILHKTEPKSSNFDYPVIKVPLLSQSKKRIYKPEIKCFSYDSPKKQQIKSKKLYNFSIKPNLLPPHSQNRFRCATKAQSTGETFIEKSFDKRWVSVSRSYGNTLNPVYMMAFSGARGNLSQVRQLVGMRGLMADPQGQLVEFPIQSNFREGLTVTEYMISCYGARKGIVDTALRTAAAGYLTRRLVDVSHHQIVRFVTCGTKDGILLPLHKDDKKQENNEKKLPSAWKVGLKAFPNNAHNGVRLNFSQKKSKSANLSKAELKVYNSDLVPFGLGVGGSLTPLKKSKPLTFCIGRVLARDIPGIAFRNQEVDISLGSSEVLREIYETTGVSVRSPLTCKAETGICQLCYGWSVSANRLVGLGEAVGIIAAQSIGEPGTQLTMRTFHTGGVFSGDIMEECRAKHEGVIFFHGVYIGLMVRTAGGAIAFCLKTIGILTVQGLDKVTTYTFLPNTLLFIRQGEKVLTDTLLAQIPNLPEIEEASGESTKTLVSSFSGEVRQTNIINRELENIRILAGQKDTPLYLQNKATETLHSEVVISTNFLKRSQTKSSLLAFALGTLSKTKGCAPNFKNLAKKFAGSHRFGSSSGHSLSSEIPNDFLNRNGVVPQASKTSFFSNTLFGHLPARFFNMELLGSLGRGSKSNSKQNLQEQDHFNFKSQTGTLHSTHSKQAQANKTHILVQLRCTQYFRNQDEQFSQVGVIPNSSVNPVPLTQITSVNVIEPVFRNSNLLFIVKKIPKIKNLEKNKLFCSTNRALHALPCSFKNEDTVGNKNAFLFYSAKKLVEKKYDPEQKTFNILGKPSSPGTKPSKLINFDDRLRASNEIPNLNTYHAFGTEKGPRLDPYRAPVRWNPIRQRAKSHQHQSPLASAFKTWSYRPKSFSPDIIACAVRGKEEDAQSQIYGRSSAFSDNTPWSYESQSLRPQDAKVLFTNFQYSYKSSIISNNQILNLNLSTGLFGFILNQRAKTSNFTFNHLLKKKIRFFDVQMYKGLNGLLAFLGLLTLQSHAHWFWKLSVLLFVQANKKNFNKRNFKNHSSRHEPINHDQTFVDSFDTGTQTLSPVKGLHTKTLLLKKKERAIPLQKSKPKGCNFPVNFTILKNGHWQNRGERRLFCQDFTGVYGPSFPKGETLLEQRGLNFDPVAPSGTTQAQARVSSMQGPLLETHDFRLRNLHLNPNYLLVFSNNLRQCKKKDLLNKNVECRIIEFSSLTRSIFLRFSNQEFVKTSLSGILSQKLSPQENVQLQQNPFFTKPTPIIQKSGEIFPIQGNTDLNNFYKSYVSRSTPSLMLKEPCTLFSKSRDIVESTTFAIRGTLLDGAPKPLSLSNIQTFSKERYLDDNLKQNLRTKEPRTPKLGLVVSSSRKQNVCFPQTQILTSKPVLNSLESNNSSTLVACVKKRTCDKQINFLTSSNNRLILTHADRISFKLPASTNGLVLTNSTSWPKTQISSYGPQLGCFINIGDEILKKFGSPLPGQIIEKSRVHLTLRRTQNILYSNLQSRPAKVSRDVQNGNWLSKGTPLVTLPYLTNVTGDIVAGIPKIEQLFEARGEALYETIDKIWFFYKTSMVPPAKAVRECLKEIGLFLVSAIQKVYSSQGVQIADKHLEVIVRQMTRRAIIVNPGDTSFLTDEFIDVQIIERVNWSTYGENASYQPCLVGITKASLTSNSFLSSASFQQTARVLERETFLEKTDRLLGLKERVMMGAIIYAGTGDLNTNVRLPREHKVGKSVYVQSFKGIGFFTRRKIQLT